MNTLSSFVLTPHFGMPPPDDLLREWRAMHGRSPKTVVRETSALVCEAGTLRAVVTPHRGLVAGSVVDDGSLFTASRFLERPKAGSYVAHLSVASSCPRVSMAEMELHVTLLAALAKTLEASGVHWSPMTHPAEFVIETAEARKPLTALWCGVGYAKDTKKPGHVSYLSHGLSHLGLREIEVVCAEQEANDGFHRLLDLAAYVSKLGRELTAGEPVGATGTLEKLPVQLAPSPIDAGQQVSRDELPHGPQP
ncbi:MAG: hypothetical protein ACO1OB_16095 [Archangium sp.]